MPREVPGEVELLGRVLDVERDLRRTVKTIFAHERDDWERLVPSSIRQRLEAEREKAQVPWGPSRSSEILDFASMGELADILAGRWKFFQNVFGEKPILMAKLDELRMFRNAVAHGTQLSEDDLVRLRLLVEDVERRIPELVKQRPSDGGAPRGPPPPSQKRGVEQPSGDGMDPILERVRSRYVREALHWILTEADFRVIGGFPRRVRFPVSLRIRREPNMNARVEIGQVDMTIVFPHTGDSLEVDSASTVDDLKEYVDRTKDA